MQRLQRPRELPLRLHGERGAHLASHGLQWRLSILVLAEEAGFGLMLVHGDDLVQTLALRVGAYADSRAWVKPAALHPFFHAHETKHILAEIPCAAETSESSPLPFRSKWHLAPN